MAINFPTGATPNQIYTYNGLSWRWTGSYWEDYTILNTGVGFGVIQVTGTTQFTSASSPILNFSGINITITSAATNTLVFSAGTGGGGGTVTSVALSAGTSGTDVNISNSAITTSGTITLNIPDASSTARGLITTGTQTIAGNKTINGNLTITGNTTISGLTASQLIATDANDTLVSLSTSTYPSLTELSYVKGVTSAIQTQIDNTYIARVQSVVSSATVTPTFANDEVIITAQAVNLTLNNPTGTATEGKSLIVRIKDNGTARSITFDTQYRAVNVNLPTSTTASRTLYLGMIYNATDTRWDVTGVALENANPDNTVQLLYYSNNC